VVETFFKSSESVVLTQRMFRKKFNITRHGKVPNRRTIKVWMEKFRSSGSVFDKKPGGSKRTVRTPENIDRVRVPMDKNPRRSAFRHAAIVQVREIGASNIG